MKLEVYFDYACPYCYKGHKNLTDLLEKYQEIEIIWRPCEAHPRPERMDIHSDTAIQGMLILQDLGGDLMKYHQHVYAAMFDKNQDISDLRILAAIAEKCGVDADAFEQHLRNNLYAEKVLEYNKDAWQTRGCTAVPSYVCNDDFIGSRDGILVSRQQLDDFIRKHY